MILYVNVFVTNTRISKIRYNRYGLGNPNRFDVFKYTLASLSALNKYWSKIVIYIQLGKEFRPRWPELEAFVQSIFPPEITQLSPYRLHKQKQWQESWRNDLEKEEDRLIWYQGNDDHIFIDYDLDYMDCLLNKMYNDPRRHISCIYSHWPEYIRFSAGHAHNVGCAAVFPSHNTDAIHIITKDVFYDWWFKWNWKNMDCRRTDFIKFLVRYTSPCYVPYRELVRHFDGYSHSMHLPHICPPLHIPHGFFKRNIKILYCGQRKYLKPGWTLVNPLLPYKTVARKHGADFRYTLDDLPLFWKDRISQIEVATEIPKNILYRARNREKKAFFGPHRFTTRVLGRLPIHWMDRWLFLRPRQPLLA